MKRHILAMLLTACGALVGQTEPSTAPDPVLQLDESAPNPYAPYSIPEPVTVCHIDTMTGRPVVDPATGADRCLTISVDVSKSMTLWLLTQSAGLDANGNKAYKYASWWDLVVKHVAKTLVLPILDRFPPEDVRTAKEQAAAAAKAVEDKKAAAFGLSGQ